MAITLGTFTQLDDGVLTGTFKTLNVTASLVIVPIDKTSDKAPDHRVYAGPRHEVGAGWSQVAKSSGETYINLKIGSPEFGPNWVAAASSSSTSRPKTAPPTSPSGNRATSEHYRPAAPRRGFFAQPPLLSNDPSPAVEAVSPDFPIIPCRPAPVQGGACPQFCRAERARQRAGLASHATKSAPPRPASRRLWRP